ncbi:MAG: ribonuclease HII, partial [Mesorhizobium sp.]
ACEGRALIKGDQRSQSIAAASIVAKVMRDRMMCGCGGHHDRYGFEVHMGYATARHRTAIEAHGPVARLHRASFAPFRLGGVEVVEEESFVGLE